MTKKETIRTILLLGFISACIYGLQIVLFHDVRNTEFYILQDLAFIPVSIAITTIVVGNIMDSRARKEASEKAAMLRAVFFTDIGRTLMMCLYKVTDSNILSFLDEDISVSEKQKRIHSCNIQVHTDKDTYEFIRTFLQSKQQDLMTLSGNNDLMDQDDFTQLLGGLFHLLDEFSLRGSYDQLNESDIMHMDDDFSKVLILLCVNMAANADFQQKHFPDFYQKAFDKVKH